MKTALTVIVSVAISLLFGSFLFDKGDHTSNTKETAFERVMRTGVLRCGYNVWPPALSVDPNTGEVTGILKEITEKAAAGVNLKVEWVTQVGWATFAEDLKNDRYDAMCAGAWQIKEIAPTIAFTKPVFFNPLYAYVRIDESNIKADYSNLNDPKFKIVFADGSMSQTIAEEDFPKAKLISYGDLTHPSELVENVALGKADIYFVESNVGEDYIKNNPNKVRRLTNEPYRTFASPLLAFKMGEHNLVQMFDTVITEMQLHGTVDKIIEKYDPERVNFIPVAPAYQIKEDN